jgi:hypothetical protein
MFQLTRKGCISNLKIWWKCHVSSGRKTAETTTCSRCLFLPYCLLRFP